MFIFQGGNTTMWNVQGKRMYRVELKVPEECNKVDEKGIEKLIISCTCPDAFKRKDNDKRLCKHASASLMTLVDPEAEDRLKRKMKETKLAEIEESKAAFLRMRHEEERMLEQVVKVQQAQEQMLPGERQRKFV